MLVQYMKTRVMQKQLSEPSDLPQRVNALWGKESRWEAWVWDLFLTCPGVVDEVEARLFSREDPANLFLLLDLGRALLSEWDPAQHSPH